VAKKKIFISSVQSEFSEERKALHDYLLADPLLGRFFEPFLFELLPAMDQGRGTGTSDIISTIQDATRY